MIKKVNVQNVVQNETIELCFSTLEVQQIADCLTFIEVLITLEAQ